MNTVWIVDGTYLSKVLQANRSVKFIGELERELTSIRGTLIKRSIYFDVSLDIDHDLATPYFSGLRSGVLRTPFDVRLIPLSGANDIEYHNALRLLAVDAAVEAIRAVAEDHCDRVVFTTADPALEPAISAVRLSYSRELWLHIADNHRSPVLESFADHVIKLPI